jgi:hypothetical protein
MVSALMLIAVAIPAIIWLSWRRFRGGPQQREPRLRKWLSGEFVTWQGRLNAREAAVQVLLPLAAVAFGLTASGIVLAITAATFAPA